MKKCRECSYFRKNSSPSSLTLMGKCQVEPSDMLVSPDRPQCRHFIDKNNHLGESDENYEILAEST